MYSAPKINPDDLNNSYRLPQHLVVSLSLSWNQQQASLKTEWLTFVEQKKRAFSFRVTIWRWISLAALLELKRQRGIKIGGPF